MKQDGQRFTLENEDLLVAVNRHGAELARIYDKLAGRELLWNADPAVWNRHAPILFPFVGKCYDGKYRHQEKEYPMGAHGFARDMEFEPLLCDMDECWYRLKDTPETFSRYPFHFELEVGHRLEGRTIQVMWKVNNTGSEDLLFMAGGHPAFRVPEGRTIYDYTFEFNKTGTKAGTCQDGLHYQAPNADGFEQEDLGGTLALTDGRVPLTKGFFDRALTYIFDQAAVGSVSLLLDGKPYVTVRCDEFPYLGVWTVENTHPFVCLEPWYGRCDAEGYTGELKDREGVVTLPAWESWEKSYSITIGE